MGAGLVRVPRRQLGNTGIDVPCLSLGTVKFGRNAGVKYPQAFKLPDDNEVTSLLQLAFDSGINLIDTAPAYGTSERRIGQLLPGSRDNWLICTKAGERYVNEESSYDFSSDAVNESVHSSLKNLSTDYLDIVLIHSDGNDLGIIKQSDALETLYRLKESGLVRWVGMSTKSIEGGLAAIAVCDVIMVELNTRTRHQLPVISAAAEAGCGVFIKKSMDSGHGSPSASLTYVLENPQISTVVTGTINTTHLQQNIDIARHVA